MNAKIKKGLNKFPSFLAVQFVTLVGCAILFFILGVFAFFIYGIICFGFGVWTAVYSTDYEEDLYGVLCSWFFLPFISVCSEREIHFHLVGNWPFVVLIAFCFFPAGYLLTGAFQWAGKTRNPEKNPVKPVQQKVITEPPVIQEIPQEIKTEMEPQVKSEKEPLKEKQPYSDW